MFTGSQGHPAKGFFLMGKITPEHCTGILKLCFKKFVFGLGSATVDQSQDS